MGGSLTKPPQLWKDDRFRRFGYFKENDQTFELYTYKKAKMFPYGSVEKDTKPPASISELTQRHIQEHEHIAQILSDYPVSVAETRILNAQYQFRTDRAYGVFAIVYYVPSEKRYRTGWCYGVQILIPPTGRSVEEITEYLEQHTEVESR